MPKSLPARLLKSMMTDIVNSAMDAIVSVDEEQRIVMFNAAAEKMFLCPAENALGKSLDHFIPERYRTAHRQHLDDFGRTGTTTRIGSRLSTLRGLRGNGEEFPIEASVSKVEMNGRKIYTAVLRDVTERQRAELEVREQERYFRSLIEYATDLITLMDDKGVVHFQSPAVERILNLNPEALIGHNISEFIHPEDSPRLSAMIRRAITNPDQPVALECRMRAQDGAWHLFAAVGRSFPYGDGKWVVFNSRDITASRNLEEQLLQAQKMEAIGSLAGGIAHDFNNMLAGILGSAELVREDLGTSHPSQEYVQSIITAANRARELVQQILTFSRRQESEKQILRLQPVIGECIKLLRSTIPAMVKITHYVQPQCPPVLADPTQFHQVIMNICTNAWHALPETGGHIDINLKTVEVTAEMAAQRRQLPPGSYVRLAITDNGCGMDAAVRARIFEPFFTTKPANKGSGLGLSVVHGIIKSHRGMILVESEPGKGSTFEIYLPARATNPKESVLATRMSVPHGNGERILYVDDEPIVGKSTEEFLRRLGYIVTRFDKSDEALERFREAPHAFDLIITDWAMPGMSGTELISAIRQTRPEIPMLLVSGFVGALAEGMAKEAGIAEVLIKPVEMELLAQAVAQVLLRAAKAGQTQAKAT
ncbi:MAG: PAS domain S-box protein [Limisphaerales bacterium]